MIDHSNDDVPTFVPQEEEIKSNCNTSGTDTYNVMDHPTDIVFTTKYRLSIRISMKLAENEYLPLTFICNTAVTSDVCLCRQVYHLLKSRIHRVANYEDNYMYMNILGKIRYVEMTSGIYKQCNMIGWKLLKDLDMHLGDRTSINSKITYF